RTRELERGDAVEPGAAEDPREGLGLTDPNALVGGSSALEASSDRRTDIEVAKRVAYHRIVKRGRAERAERCVLERRLGMGDRYAGGEIEHEPSDESAFVLVARVVDPQADRKGARIVVERTGETPEGSAAQHGDGVRVDCCREGKNREKRDEREN